MNKESFWKVVHAIVERARSNHQIMTGFPAIDETNEQLTFTRAIEILEKAVALESVSNDEEKKAVAFLDSFGMDRVTLKTELIKAWAAR